VVRRLIVSSSDRGAESPVYAAEPAASVSHGDLAASGPRGIGGGHRTAHGDAPGSGAPRHAGIRRAGCRPVGRKMVCKGHPCIYTADGDSMTQFAFPKAVPCGRRRPRKLTDVHGREG
jgi:hypothetical protein